MLDHVPAPGHVASISSWIRKFGRREREVQRGGIGDRSQRIVRRHAHVVGLGHGGDLLGFQQPAAVAQIGLDDMGGLFFEDLAELVAGDEPLAGGDGYAHGLAHLGQRVDIFGRHGLLAKVRPKFCDRVDVLDRHGGIGAAVEVDHDIDAVADGVAQAAHHGGELLDVGMPINGSEYGTKTTFTAV